MCDHADAATRTSCRSKCRRASWRATSARAAHNRDHFCERALLAINVMGSPGAGKTAVLEATARALARTAADSARSPAISPPTTTPRRLAAAGIRARAITTGSACHLDAAMVHRALHHLPWNGSRLPLHRERRQSRLPRRLRPRPGRQRRRAVGHGRGGQAAEVSRHVPQGGPGADLEDRSAAAPAEHQRRADRRRAVERVMPEPHYIAVSATHRRRHRRVGHAGSRNGKRVAPTQSRPTGEGARAPESAHRRARARGDGRRLAAHAWRRITGCRSPRSRARSGWSRGRTARITAACGFGHVTVSALLGVLALFFGLETAAPRRPAHGSGRRAAADGVRPRLRHRRPAPRVSVRTLHGHHHHHFHLGGGAHVAPRARRRSMTPWALFLLFSADPCVAVIPILFAAAPLGGLADGRSSSAPTNSPRSRRWSRSCCRATRRRTA